MMLPFRLLNSSNSLPMGWVPYFYLLFEGKNVVGKSISRIKAIYFTSMACSSAIFFFQIAGPVW